MGQTTALPGVLILQPRRFSDNRGFFNENFNAREFEAPRV
jgi:dTDP-4-dehydrorhamnose 3,5-epimerase-like enzyme